MGYSISTLQVLLFLIGSFALVCESTNCSMSSSLEDIRQLRLEQLRDNILAQLGFTKDPTVPDDAEVLPMSEEDKLRDQMVEQQYFDLINSPSEPRKCTADEFYAKPITSFVGMISPAEGLVSRLRRSSEEDALIDPGILNQYIINANFNLPSNLRDISRANLLLYQNSANTIDLDTREKKQQVEIRTIINNVRYFVEQKSLNIFESGYQSFDITLAAELWVQEEVTGSVVLEVLVTCYSSPNCSKDTTLAKVSFTQDIDDTRKIPRIVTYSKNSLEHTSYRGSRNRQKRQSNNSTSFQYCSNNDNEACCLHPLNINFHNDLGINFISRPPYFTSNFCNGYCIPSTGLGDIGSLILQSMPGTEKCCSGIEYQPLQVLMTIYNHRKRIFTKTLGRLDQVIVTKCSCA